MKCTLNLVCHDRIFSPSSCLHAGLLFLFCFLILFLGTRKGRVGWVGEGLGLGYRHGKCFWEYRFFFTLLPGPYYLFGCGPKLMCAVTIFAGFMFSLSSCLVLFLLLFSISVSADEFVAYLCMVIYRCHAFPLPPLTCTLSVCISLCINSCVVTQLGIESKLFLSRLFIHHLLSASSWCLHSLSSFLFSSSYGQTRHWWYS